MRVDSSFLATIREPLLALRPFDCVKKYRLGTSKCHDHDILTLHQPIRLQHLERGNEKTGIPSCLCERVLLLGAGRLISILVGAF